MRLLAPSAALLLAAACAGGRPAPAGSPTGSAAGSPAPGSASPTPRGVTVVSVPDGFRGGFRTPTGNVRCDVDADFVRCDATERPWEEQPERDCGGTAEWRTRLVLDAGHGAALRGECGYDPPAGGPPLAYGTRLDVGRTRCYSERTGLTCWATGTPYAFFVARAAYRLSATPPAAAASATPEPAPGGPVLVVPHGFRGGFRTTGHHVVCDIDGTRVHCLPFAARWTPPPGGEPCTDGDRSTEVILRDGPGRAFAGCRSDSLAGGAELEPGHGIQVGDVRCDATRSGLECRNLATGHGFVLTAAAFRGY